MGSYTDKSADKMPDKRVKQDMQEHKTRKGEIDKKCQNCGEVTISCYLCPVCFPKACEVKPQGASWQSINTAPKDGTRILSFGTAYQELADDGFSWCVADSEKQPRPFICIIKWIEGWYDKEVDAGGGLYKKERTQGYAYWMPHAHAFMPTHWMPLPEPPKTEVS